MNYTPVSGAQYNFSDAQTPQVVFRHDPRVK